MERAWALRRTFATLCCFTALAWSVGQGAGMLPQPQSVNLIQFYSVIFVCEPGFRFEGRYEIVTARLWVQEVYSQGHRSVL